MSCENKDVRYTSTEELERMKSFHTSKWDIDSRLLIFGGASNPHLSDEFERNNDSMWRIEEELERRSRGFWTDPSGNKIIDSDRTEPYAPKFTVGVSR